MGFLMPKFHNRSDHPLGLAVGLGIPDLCKPLLDPLIPAQGHKRMVFRIPPILFSIVGVVLFNRIGTFLQDLLQKDPGRLLGLVRQDCSVKLTGEIIDGHKQVFPSLEYRFPFEQRQPFRVPVQHLAGIILVVAPGLTL